MPDPQLRVRVTADTSGAKNPLTELKSLVDLVEKAVRAVGQAYEATIGKTVAYATEIRRLSDATGASAEDTSRLLQVVDDFQIEAGDLETAMRTLRTAGLVPSVESLAQMSDQFMSLNPGIDRTNFLMERFGRQGLAFATLMEQGGDAVREMSAAVGDNLVMTEQQLEQAREMELAVDQLNDSWNGIIYTLSEGVIPTITSWLADWDQVLNGTWEWSKAAFEAQRHAAVLNGELAELSGEARGLNDALRSIPTALHTNLSFTTNLRQLVADNPELAYLWPYLGGTARTGLMMTATEYAQNLYTGNMPSGGGGGGGGHGYWDQGVFHGTDTEAQATAAWNALHGHQAGGQLAPGWNRVERDEVITPTGGVIPVGHAGAGSSDELLQEMRRVRGELSTLARTLPTVIRDAVERLT